MTDQLRQILEQTAPAPARTLSIAAVTSEVRRRRKARMLLSLFVAALLAVAGSVAAAVAVNSGSNASVSTVVTSPTPGPTFAPPIKPSVSLSAPGPFHDGAVVGVTGTGYAPNDFVNISQCPHGNACPEQAFGGGGTLRADSDGAFSTRVTVHALVPKSSGGFAPCETACTFLVYAIPHDARVGSAAFDVIPPSLALQAPACTAAQLQGSDGGSVSPETGERSVIVNLANVGAAACGLVGYPKIDLLANGSTLRYQENHGGPFIFETPRSIVLQPAQFAHVLVADSCCSTSPGPTATTLRLTLPTVDQAVDVALASGGGLSETPGPLQIGPFAAGREVGQ
jgi:hypothetical protein